MSIDFNFKSSAASATKQKSPPVLWSFEARHWLLPSSYESPRWHLHLLKGGYFIYIENLSLIIFISYISQLFWITCYSFYTSPFYFILQSVVMEMASFLKPHEPISSNFKLFSYSFLASLSSQIRIRICPGLGFGVRECCGWFDILSRPLKVCVSAIRLFLIICVFFGVSLLTSSKNFSFAFTICTTGTRWGTFYSVLDSDMLSSLRLILSSFLFKVRDMQLFFPLEHLEATVCVC